MTSLDGFVITLQPETSGLTRHHPLHQHRIRSQVEAPVGGVARRHNGPCLHQRHARCIPRGLPGRPGRPAVDDQFYDGTSAAGEGRPHRRSVRLAAGETGSRVDTKRSSRRIAPRKAWTRSSMESPRALASSASPVEQRDRPALRAQQRPPEGDPKARGYGIRSVPGFGLLRPPQQMKSSRSSRSTNSRPPLADILAEHQLDRQARTQLRPGQKAGGVHPAFRPGCRSVDQGSRQGALGQARR